MSSFFLLFLNYESPKLIITIKVQPNKHKLDKYINEPFHIISYTEVIEKLEKKVQEGVKFEFPPVWGSSLQTEHEKFICEVIFFFFFFFFFN